MTRKKQELETFIIILGVLGILIGGALLGLSLLVLDFANEIGGAIYGTATIFGACTFAISGLRALMYVHKAQG